MTNKEMINKFKDMADIADASYALLNEVYKIDEWNKIFGDKQTLGSTFFNKDINTEQNSTYARAIEARFCNEMIIKDDDGKDKQIKSIKDISLQATLSHRTKNFVNRYELVSHIPNTLSGFSATIFYDIKESNTTTNTKEFKKHFEYIIAFRGTESTKEIV
ncbi:hypothetical protein [Helicobacter trogontum]|uniref:Uncharacterized protein n=2 Tax=Helicobacter trogontum TaxID=50960 RepID=A0ABQ0D3R5_9HELI|nr:hypothetical protein [Helicobacter trogontum]MDY5185696.1 hypothetical protein [Helicobacter trogontum]